MCFRAIDRHIPGAHRRRTRTGFASRPADHMEETLSARGTREATTLAKRSRARGSVRTARSNRIWAAIYMGAIDEVRQVVG